MGKVTNNYFYHNYNQLGSVDLSMALLGLIYFTDYNYEKSYSVYCNLPCQE